MMASKKRWGLLEPGSLCRNSGSVANPFPLQEHGQGLCTDNLSEVPEGERKLGWGDIARRMH